MMMMVMMMIKQLLILLKLMLLQIRLVLKKYLIGQTGNIGTKNVEIIVPLKYLSNLWRTLKLSLINSEINLGLSWSENCVIVASDVVAQATTFSVTDTKRYVPVVTLSTQDN